MFGILGCVFFSIYYFKIFFLVKNNFNYVVAYYRTNKVIKDPLFFMFLIYGALFIISRLIAGSAGFFGEIIQGEARVSSIIVIGFIIAAYEKIREKIEK